MATGWRLVKTKFAATAYSGEGARVYGGRWNSPGVPVVYLSGSVSLAMLEVLVHTEDAALLEAYSLGSVEFDPKLLTSVDEETLPSNWMAVPPPVETQLIGDSWVRDGASVLLRVPSAVARGEFNLLVNPSHAKFTELEIGPLAPFRFDERLGKKGISRRGAERATPGPLR